MSGLEDLKIRLQYNGGYKQESRMQLDKLRTLKKALIYSYQAATAILEDGREFRCLINPDKNKLDYDDKIISIPYKDICLNKEKSAEKTSQGEEEIGMKVGDVFTWKETNTNWLVYLERLEEDAYFRAEIRKCNNEIEINDKKYKVYTHGPDVESILWHTRRGFGSWSDLNYDLTMWVTKNEDTEAFFHRFNKIEIKGNPWEICAADFDSTPGLIEVQLKETFRNTIADEKKAEEEALKPINPEPDEEEQTLPHIIGDAIVYPYDTKTYTIVNLNSGTWKLSNNKAKITAQTDSEVTIVITTSKSGSIDLIYNKDENDIIYNITIKSL